MVKKSQIKDKNDIKQDPNDKFKSLMDKFKQEYKNEDEVDYEEEAENKPNQIKT